MLHTRITTVFSLLFVGIILIAMGWFGVFIWHQSDNSAKIPDLTQTGRSTLRINQDFASSGPQVLSDIPDSSMLGHFDTLQQGFSNIALSLTADTAIAKETINKEVNTSQETSIISDYDLADLDIRTEYTRRTADSNTKQLGQGEGSENVKQTITLTNPTDTDKHIPEFTVTTQIASDTVTYEGEVITLSSEPRSFKAQEKTAPITEYAKDTGSGEMPGLDEFKNYTHTYLTGATLTFDTADGKQAVYDWSDAATLNHEIHVYKNDRGSFIDLIIKETIVPAHGAAVIDPTYSLATAGVADLRLDGDTTQDGHQFSDAIRVGDVNGDSKPDLVIGDTVADNNGKDSGSVYVIFGHAGPNVGNIPMDIAVNFDIRYDGAAANDRLGTDGAITIGDVNGDGENDLILGTYYAANNGGISGSVWVIFSTLLDDAGIRPGNIRPLSTATNYNIRYDGSGSGVELVCDGALTTGDVNGDGLGDLIMGTYYATTSSAWVIFSTLIDDVGTSTGNNKVLSTAGSYNIRYDGASGDKLTRYGTVKTGDVNGDGLGDLILGAPLADNNGTDSGSAYVMFSTLIDDIGATTGNNKSLATATNYNIRYDGTAAGEYFPRSSMAVGDVNGDSAKDLVFLSWEADTNGSTSGAVWIMFSTLVDDIGETTGNVKALSTATNYNIRYDGYTSSAYLGDSAAFGDVNGDGLGDLVIGDSDEAFVYVFFPPSSMM